MNIFASIFTDILDILYPPTACCKFCGSHLKRLVYFGLCSYCMSRLPFLSDNTCTRCGRTLSDNYSASGLCRECGTDTIYFDEGCSVFEYTGLIKSVLYRLKYNGDMEVAFPIGKLMAKKLKSKHWKIDVIIPVPLHTEKLKERGYNQSYLLSCEVGRECGIDIKADGLVRKRYTESQTTLSKLERMNNIKNAFDVSSKECVKNKAVLVVDDIITTGATLNECSRIIKKNGAKKIYCLTAASPSYYF